MNRVYNSSFTTLNLFNHIWSHQIIIFAAITFGIIDLKRTQHFTKIFHFLSPDIHPCVCVSGGQKCKFFGTFCVRTKWMIPFYVVLSKGVFKTRSNVYDVVCFCKNSWLKLSWTLKNIWGIWEIFTGKNLPFHKQISYLDKEYKKYAKRKTEKMRKNIPTVSMLRLLSDRDTWNSTTSMKNYWTYPHILEKGLHMKKNWANFTYANDSPDLTCWLLIRQWQSESVLICRIKKNLSRKWNIYSLKVPDRQAFA